MRMPVPFTANHFRRVQGVARSKKTWQVLGVMLAALAIFLVVGRLSMRATIEGMAQEIRSSDDNAAARLVHKLSAFGSTAYGELVRAANSKRSAVALAARDEIDKLVDEWQQTARLHPSSFDLGDRALPLAKNIELELSAMTASGRRWARRTLIDLLELAQQQDLDDRLELLRVCDRALSSLPSEDPLVGFEPSVDYRLTLSPAPAASERVFVSQPRSVQLSPVPNEVSLNDPPPMPPSMSESASEAVELNAPEPLELAMPAGPLKAIPMEELLEWDPDWSANAISKNSIPPQAVDQSNPDAVDNDQKLFELLASGTAEQQQAAAKALRERGYGAVSPLDARMMVSPSPNDRAAMVSRAMTTPQLEATKWLWRLAHDPSGQVRAAAISAISTSGNQQLITAAMELAIRDTDPRVAEKATQLQKLLR